MERKRAAVDFDGVLSKHDGWVSHHHYGELIEDGRTLCRWLRQHNYEIIILTSRMCEEFTSKSKLSRVKLGLEDWLTKNDVPFDFVWDGIGKPACTAYFDDRAICFDPQNDPFAFVTSLQNLTQLEGRKI